MDIKVIGSYIFFLYLTAIRCSVWQTNGKSHVQKLLNMENELLDFCNAVLTFERVHYKDNKKFANITRLNDLLFIAMDFL